MPMPPWSWIDCWPTNFCGFTDLHFRRRYRGGAFPGILEIRSPWWRTSTCCGPVRPRRTCRRRGAAGSGSCRSATPNCVRVLRYSTVDFSDSSIAPTASAHIAMRASSTTRSISGNAIFGIADCSVGAGLDAGKGDVGGVQAVLSRIALAWQYPWRSPGTRNTPTPAASRLAALGARSHDQECLRSRR